MARVAAWFNGNAKLNGLSSQGGVCLHNYSALLCRLAPCLARTGLALAYFLLASWTSCRGTQELRKPARSACCTQSKAGTHAPYPVRRSSSIRRAPRPPSPPAALATAPWEDEGHRRSLQLAVEVQCSLSFSGLYPSSIITSIKLKMVYVCYYDPRQVAACVYTYFLAISSLKALRRKRLGWQ
eukprot:6187633-Pleurochrysis_carterae.AAC.3